ncbi:hypothetical protein MnTg02_00733 [bacterium MnTg02]|nr:hypothetical protein MnTg02_00733 [bacterium MnTg02]
MSEDSLAIRQEMPEDQSEIQKLHARVFGPGRFTRTAYRVRETGAFDQQLSWVAFAGKELAGAVRLTPIRIGGRDRALLLGPLIVAPQFAGKGYGRRLIAASLEAARAEGFALVLLVGDLAYYEAFGFGPVPPGQIMMPGPVDPARLLAAELMPGTLERYSGLMRAER